MDLTRLEVLILEELKKEIEEAVVDPGLTKSGQWPGVSPAQKAADLAQKGMRQAAGMEDVPPWESGPESQYPAPSGDSVTDEDVIRSIYNLLKDNQSPAYKSLAGRFMEMMKERDVISIESADDIRKGNSIRSARMSGFDEEL